MASISVGSVSIDVVPSVRNFASQIRREILPEADRVGREAGRRIQAGIENGVRPVDIQVNMGTALARLQRLRDLVSDIDGRTVNVTVNVDLANSLAEIRLLGQLLDRLDGRNVNIQVDMQIASVLAQMAAVQAAANRLDGQRSRLSVNMDIGGALASISTLRAALIGLGLLASPALTGIGAGIIGLVGPLSAAAVGFGGLAAVAVPSVMRISEALKAQEQAQKQAVSTAAQAQSRAFAMAGAQQQLAAAIRQAGYAHKQALDQVRRAEQDLAAAQRSALAAQRELNEARGQARRDLQDLANDVASARLAERQATFDLADAEAELARLRADPKATQDQIARAQLEVDQARQRLKEQQLATRRLIEDEKKARKAGVEGSDLVRQARERLEEANRRVTESERELADARANVARVDQQSAEAVASARRALAQASMQSAAATNNLAYAMAQLSPLERQLMSEWQGLTDVFKAWQKSLQPDVIPVLIKGIGLVKQALPALAPIVRASAQAVGGLLDEMAAAAKSPFWTQFGQFLADAAGPAITGLGRLAGSLVTAFAGIAQGFAPIGFAFLEILNTLAARFAAFATGLTENPAFQAFVAQFKALAPLMTETIASLGSLVGSLFQALAPAMQGSLELFRGLATALSNVFRGIGPAIASVFNTLGPAITAVANSLAPVLVQLGNALAPLINQLITGLQPILVGLAPILGQVISYLQPVIAALIAGLQPAIASLVPVVGLLVQLLGRVLVALAPILPVLGRFIASLVAGLMPILTPIADAIAQVAEQIAGTLIQALQQSLPALQQMLLAVASLLPELIPLIPLWAEWFAAIAPLLPTLVQLAAVLVTALVPVLRIVIQAVVLVWRTIATLVLPIFRLMVTVIQWVAAILTPIITAIGWLIRSIGTAAMWLWQNAIQPAFRAIGTIAQWLYSFVMVVLIAPLLLAFKLVQAAVGFLYRAVIKPIFTAIGAVVRWAWNTLIQPPLSALVSFLQKTLGPVFRWIYSSVIKPIWDKVGAAIRWVWDNAIKPAFDAIKKGVSKLGDAFKVGVDAIGRAWDKLKDAAKKPVNFVIGTVFNKGIVGVWNAVARLVPGVKELSPLPTFATGGIYPGYTPGRDIGLAAVSGGEAIMRPEFTRAVGEDFIHSANAAARAGGVGGVARFLAGVGDPGGVAGVPFAGHFFLGGVIDGFKKAAKGFFIGGLRKAAEKVFGPLQALADRTLGKMGGFGQLMAGIPRGLIAKIMSFFGPLEDKIGGPGKRAVAAARKQLGVPYSWGGGGLDGPTRGIGRGANTVGFDCSALLRYGWYQATKKIAPRTTYTQIPWVKRIPKPVPGAFGFPHSGHVFMASDKPNRIIEAPYTGAHVREVPMRSAWWGLPPWKFDNGGFLPTGPSLVYNGTGSPEPVFTDAQWRRIEENTVGGDGGDHYHLHMDGMTRAAYEAQMRSGFAAMSAQRARKDRTRRRR